MLKNVKLVLNVQNLAIERKEISKTKNTSQHRFQYPLSTPANYPSTEITWNFINYVHSHDSNIKFVTFLELGNAITRE